MLRISSTTANLPLTRVMLRFGVRTAILVTFAAFGTSGFGSGLAALLWMTIILCAVIGVLRREPMFAAGLNHWDEMAAYTALYCAVTALNQSGPI